MSRRTKKPPGSTAAASSEPAVSSTSPLSGQLLTDAENDPDLWQLSKEVIKQVTDGFSSANLLGEGGFSKVYKGLLYGTDVAVKQLKVHATGDIPQASLLREVAILARLRHPHIMLLMGCCPEDLCVVTEYMAGGSLQDRLARDKVPQPPPLHWVDRFRIALEMSSGLLHMHLRKILHRDLKPDNVLLDRHNVSKLADVGLARLYSNKSTFITDIRGTCGYIDPYQQMTGQLNKQADVYALGLILLQLFMGISEIGQVHELLAELEDHVDQKQASEALRVLLHEMDGMSEDRASTKMLKDLAETVQKAVERSASRWSQGLDAVVDEVAARLDANAGDWPVQAAKQVLKLALQCVERLRDMRPDLEKEMVPQLYDLARETERLWTKQREEQAGLQTGGYPWEDRGRDRQQVADSSSADDDDVEARPEVPFRGGSSAAPSAATPNKDQEIPSVSPSPSAPEAGQEKPDAKGDTAGEEGDEMPSQPTSVPRVAADKLSAGFGQFQAIFNQALRKMSSTPAQSHPPAELASLPRAPAPTVSEVFVRTGEQPHWARRWGWLAKQRRVGLSYQWEDRFYSLYRDPLRLSVYKAMPILPTEVPDKEYLMGPSTRVVDNGKITVLGKDIFSFSIHGKGLWPLVLGCNTKEGAEGWVRSIEQAMAAEAASAANHGGADRDGAPPRIDRPVCVYDITVPTAEGTEGSELEDSALALALGNDGMLWASHGTSMKGWRGEVLLVASPEDSSMGAITALLVNTDGSIWSGSEKGAIKKWQWDEPELSLVPVAMVSVGEKVAALVATSDGTIWSAHGATVETWKHEEGQATCQSLTTFRVHTDTVEALVVAPDSRVWSGGNDGTLRAWRQGQGCVVTIDANIGPVVALAMAPDGTLWAAGRVGQIIGWKDRKCAVAIEGHTQIQPRALAVALNGMVWSGHEDSIIKAWRDGKCVVTLMDHDDSVLALAVGPDGMLWSSSADATIKGWKFL